MQHKLNILGLFVCAVSLATGQETSPFIQEAQRLLQANEAVVASASKLAAAGDATAGNILLLTLALTNKSPALSFVVGNMLYRSDTNASYNLHKAAHDAAATEPYVAPEWAMELHRHGKCGEAIPFYQQALTNVERTQFNALLADCLIRENKLSEAVTAWQKANHPHQHTAIDFAIYEIYGDILPTQRRSNLLARIKKGEKNLFEELLLLDAHFDNDWWNADVNQRTLKEDLQLATEQLKSEPDRLKVLQLFAKLKLEDELGAEKTKAAFADAGLVLPPEAALPQNSQLARAFLEAAVENKCMTAANLFALHEKSLTSRVKSPPGDADALHALCWLCVESKNGRSAEFAKLGWELWQNPTFAASFLVEALEAGKLKPDDKDLIAALDKSPEDCILNGIRIRACLATKTEPTREMLVAAIKAEYRRLSPGMMIVDSYTLKGLFAALDAKLKPGTK